MSTKNVTIKSSNLLKSYWIVDSLPQDIKIVPFREKFCSIANCNNYAVAHMNIGGFTVCNDHYSRGLWICRWLGYLYSDLLERANE